RPLAVYPVWLGHITLEIAMWNVILPRVLNGIAIGCIYVPLPTATMGPLRREQTGNGTGIFNLMRNLGGSFGIALVSTLLVRRAQVHQANIVAHLTPFDPAFVERLAAATAALTPQSGPVEAQSQAVSGIYNQLLQQSSLWAFVENFRLFGIFCLLCLPLVLLFKKVKARKGPGQMAH